MENLTTTKAPQYGLQKDWEGLGRFYIINDNSLLMITASDGCFPHYPIEVALVITEDINDILLQDVFLEEGERNKALKPIEVSRHPKFAKIRQEQQMMSFCIAIEKIIIEKAQKNIIDFNLEVAPDIHWDLLYRMSSDPHAKMDQIQTCKESITWLGDDWKDLIANYAQSVEEMKKINVPFVREKLILRLQRLIDEMTPLERITVSFLYQFFQQYSITIPVLWVKGLISGDELENAYYALASDFSFEEILKMKNEENDFVQKRLDYLKRYLEEKKLCGESDLASDFRML